MATVKSINPHDKDGAGGPGRRGHYYTPAARIELAPGVEFSKLKRWYDIYFGTAEALEESGLLRADMLPKPGSYSIAWRPLGADKSLAESWFRVPGYIEIRRHNTGAYHAHLTVSREEQAVRAAEDKRQEEEHWRKIKAAQERERLSAPQPFSGARSEEAFRETTRLFAQVLHQALIDEKGDGGPFTYSLDDDDREAVGDALDCIFRAIESGRLAINRDRLVQLKMQEKCTAARADKPLQGFLARLRGKARRAKGADHG